MVDVVLNIDSLFLEDGQSIDDVVNCLRENFEFGYEPTWEILYEEEIVDD